VPDRDGIYFTEPWRTLVAKGGGGPEVLRDGILNTAANATDPYVAAYDGA
jgi:hypothetical protein